MAEIAVGYIRMDRSGADHADEERAIRDLACRQGFHDLAMLVVERDVLMPTLLLTQAIHRFGASAVIAPTREHVWSARRGITEAASLIVVAPEESWERGHRWTRLGVPDGIGELR